MPEITANPLRTFGVEIETEVLSPGSGESEREVYCSCTAVYNGEVVEEWDEYRLVTVPSDGDTFAGTPFEGEIEAHGWRVREDGSLDECEGGVVCEVVSPVLSGQEGILQLGRIADSLRLYDATTNETCGLHIHVGHDYAPREVVAQLDEVFGLFEYGFYAMAGGDINERIERSYCKMKDQTTDSDRYRSLNLTNYQRCMRWAENSGGRVADKATLEFRCFGPTVHFLTLAGAAALSVAFVNFVYSGAAARTPLPERSRNPEAAMANLIAHVWKEEFLPPMEEVLRDEVKMHCENLAHSAKLAMGIY